MVEVWACLRFGRQRELANSHQNDTCTNSGNRSKCMKGEASAGSEYWKVAYQIWSLKTMSQTECIRFEIPQEQLLDLNLQNQTTNHWNIPNKHALISASRLLFPHPYLFWSFTGFCSRSLRLQCWRKWTTEAIFRSCHPLGVNTPSTWMLLPWHARYIQDESDSLLQGGSKSSPPTTNAIPGLNTSYPRMRSI
jgi:hypothetical protein